uniref:hypothetical protein n=1 Tax=Trichocoleus desertorum TaxID=1481672 RepID=UPI0025B3AED5|nr:hypothetical protein [Trichocoleus desertorum]
MLEDLIQSVDLNACQQKEMKRSVISNYGIVSTEALNAYQCLQMKHDEIYHHEILVLGISRRMNHVALHLIKYLGSLTSTPISAEKNRRAFIDAFIMVVSASNLLGISLEKELVIEEINTNSNESFIFGYIQLLAELAKACEATDHQEDYPIRATWNKNTKSFFRLLMHEAVSRNISIIEEAIQRITEVEKKHPLNNILWRKE